MIRFKPMFIHSIILCSALSVSAHSANFREVLQTAATNYPQLQAAYQRSLSAREGNLIAQAGYHPSLDFSAGWGKESTYNSSTRPDRLSLYRGESRLALNQMLFDGYKTKYEVDQAGLNYRLSNEELAFATQQVIFDTAVAYLDVLRQQELHALAIDKVDEHKRVYELIRQGRRKGFSSQGDVAQIEGRLALAKSDQLSAQQNLQDAKVSLEAFLGKGLTSMAPFSGKVCCDAYLPLTYKQAFEIACNTHPELAIAVTSYNQALEKQSAKKADFLPSVNLNAELAWDNDLDGVDGTQEEKLLLIRGNYNVYNGGEDVAESHQLSHRAEVEKSKILTITRRIDADLKVAWNILEKDRKRIPFLEKRAEAMTKTQQSYEKQFRLGQRTLLDLLDAETERFQAQAEYINGKYDRYRSGFQLLTAMGVLLDRLDISLLSPEQ